MSESIWTEFWDMHSGGSQKEDYKKIYIEAPIEEAKVIFYNRFGHNPERVTCTCCGEDYAMSEGTVDKVTSFHRGELSVEEYFTKEGVLAIHGEDIKDEERQGQVPKQGYVWVERL